MADWTPKTFAAAFDKMIDKMPNRIDKALTEGIDDQLQILQALAPVNKDKRAPTRGGLRAGWSVRPGRGKVTIANDARYAIYVKHQIKNAFGASHDVARKATEAITGSILKLK